MTAATDEMPGPASRRTTSLLALITRPPTPMREAAMVVTGLAVGTGIAAWPLVRNLGEGLPSRWGDTVFNAWILAWNADRLRHGLRGFWDAPLFYPYSNTLAFSEHLLGIGIFTAPIQWLTGNPIVAQNIAFLASYLLAGGGMYLLVRDLTGSRLAGFVSGVAFAFLPYRTFDTRIQVLMYGWTPLALWALHRYFTTGAPAALAAFAVAFLLQGLSNGYAFYSTAAAVAVVVVAVGVPARMRLRTLIDLTVTAVLMLTMLLPVIGALLIRSTSARHRIRHGIRHTAALAGRRLCQHVTNGRLRHRLIGYARVSEADGSQSLDRPRGVFRPLPSPSRTGALRRLRFASARRVTVAADRACARPCLQRHARAIDRGTGRAVWPNKSVPEGKFFQFSEPLRRVQAAK